jgi:hypothetical protein
MRMRAAVILVAIITIAIGITGLISPDILTAVRRLYFATPVRLYAAGAVRVSMGLVLILCASASRAPKTLRLFGALMCLQALSAMFLGPHRAPAVLEWESMQARIVQRAGAAVALASGCFMAFAVSGRRSTDLSNRVRHRPIS